MSDVTITLGNQRMGESEPSAGETRTNKPGPKAPTGIVNIRRNAALKALESERSSGGNRRSNPPAPHAASDEKRVGNVEAPAGDPPDRNSGKTENVPNQIGKDEVGRGWGKAAAAARKMAPSAR